MMRKKFLINYRLQLSIVLYFFAIGLAVAVGTYFLLSEAFRAYIDEITAGIAGIDKKEFGSVLLDLKIQVLRDFVVASIAGLFGCLLGGLFVSHRIAGPLHQLEGALKSLAETGETKEVHFRKSDFAQEIGILYNSAIKRLKP